MTDKTTIPVKRETHRLIRARKKNEGVTYDRYLRQLMGEEE